MKPLKFIWCFVKHLVVYTLSVIPASCSDAWNETFKSDQHCQRHRYDDPVRFEGPNGEKSHRRRRGHRGGKKHRHGNHHHN